MSIKNVPTLYTSLLSEIGDGSANGDCLTPKRVTKDSLCKATELKIVSEKNFMLVAK